ncbi:MAG: hypothetical protein EXQ96_02855 [Alphaproteobacteria bacterium]|nr:hypothetical protein [Alphaproteobacteria bacterium]
MPAGEPAVLGALLAMVPAESDGPAVAQAAPGVLGAQAIGRVTTVSGTVTATRVDGTVEALQVGSPIYQGDALQTGPKAAVAIIFADNATFALDQNARMVVDTYLFAPATGKGALALSVLSGVFGFASGDIVASTPGAMTIKTPRAIAGVRGSEGGGQVGDDTDTFFLNSGEMVVTSFGGSVVLSGANPTLHSLMVVVSGGALPQVSFRTVIDDHSFSRVIEIHPAQPGGHKGIQPTDTSEGDAAALGLINPAAGPADLGGIEGSIVVTLGFSGGAVTSEGGTSLIQFLGLANLDPPPVAPSLTVSDLPDEPPFVPPVPPEGGITVRGGDAGDVIVGSAFGDFLAGGGGDDFLDGGPGNDVLDGGEGNDVLAGGEGNDFLAGGKGSDDLAGGGGIDVLGGGEGNDALEGGEGNDFLAGGAGDDDLAGGAGNDFLGGGAGDDLIIGGHGEGDDAIDGGEGADTVSFASTDAGVVVDLAGGTAGGDPDIGADTLTGVENVIGGSGGDVLLGDGADNQLEGGGGDDVLVGRGGDDQLEGVGGNDVLTGGLGDDLLVGGDGADLAFFFGFPDQFAISLAAGTVKDLAGDGGTDTLVGVETAIFVVDDQVVREIFFDGTDNAPIGRTDIYFTAPGQILSVAAAGGLLANDVDLEGEVLRILTPVTRTVSGGFLQVGANGEFGYRPPTGFTGVDAFEYVVADSDPSHTDTVQVLIVVGEADADGFTIVAAGDTLAATDETLVAGG